MRQQSRETLVAMALVVTLAIAMPGVWAAEEEEAESKPWSNSAELSWVVTAGNSETMTLGFSNNFEYKWERALFVFNVGGLKADTTVTTRTAVGDITSYFVDEEESTATTAENYFANLRYERNITDRFFWYVGAGWLRNEFAGIRNRYLGSGGVGNIWRDDDKVRFRTNYGLSYNKDDDVVTVPGADDTFAGALFFWVYEHQFSKSTLYTNKFDFNLNLDETSDWRSNMLNSVAVTMTDNLALKISLLWLYNNEPAFTLADLVSPPFPPGTPTGLLVPVQLDELDSIFTTSLVVSF